MISLLLIRHGETIENANNICQGQQHGHLSDLGIKQATQLAIKLQDEALDYLISSELQ